jgi:hypothetical protein
LELEHLVIGFRIDKIVDGRSSKIEQKHGKEKNSRPQTVDRLAPVQQVSESQQKSKYACNLGLDLDITQKPLNPPES